MIVVVGAGVIGLSCAVRLAEAGLPVRVVAREATADTTSAVAAAVWLPYLTAESPRVAGWAGATYRELAWLAVAAPESGVVMRELVTLSRQELPLPWWAASVEGFAALAEGELDPPWRAGQRARVPVVETPRYLPWLLARLRRSAVEVEVRDGGFASLDEAAASTGAALVVCCAGLGARTLAADDSLVGVRGRVAVVDNPGVERVLVDDDDPALPLYVIPRRDDCVVGGTAEPGASDLGPDPAAIARLLERAVEAEPALAGATLRGERVGLRPVRPSVRLELDHTVARVPVVHCYGHGGSGYTLSWGCADEVLQTCREASAA